MNERGRHGHFCHLHLLLKSENFSLTKVSAQKFRQWLSQQHELLCHVFNAQRLKRITHATGFSQWLMTQSNERRIHSAKLLDGAAPAALQTLAAYREQERIH